MLELTPKEIKGLERPHETTAVLKEARDQAELRTVHKEATDQLKLRTIHKEVRNSVVLPESK